ncbi:hypothetical protein [Ferruginibacter albus]|uniref:hypothetical protein n=1 Tax=Ferruginibacter albus TaxID=2875540 RepID=UPI001CC4705A|nr:hypothetical protein [Ferruginibacter albus]UAY50749.1 hypothetical protein K9M53_09105 [Ferruginibacter albus]
MKYFLFFLILLPFKIIAQTNQLNFFAIEGEIRSSIGEPARYVTLTATKKNWHRIGTWSNTEGHFRLENAELGDVVKLTSVGYKACYFIADSSNKYLLITLPLDTLTTVIYTYATSKDSIKRFSFKNLFQGELKIDYIKTDKKIDQKKPYNGNQEMVKVEIQPYFINTATAFIDSLTKKIDQLNKKDKPKNIVDICLYYIITKDKNIVAQSIAGNGSEALKNTIKNSFCIYNKTKPGLQDGGNVDVFCKVKFRIEKKGKSYMVDVIE